MATLVLNITMKFKDYNKLKILPFYFIIAQTEKELKLCLVQQ